VSKETVDADAVVLDLDGVLVDVSRSYRRAILDSIEEVYGYNVEESDIQALKDAGGFNNDWDVTYALALLEITKREVQSFVEQDWFEELERRGEGLDGALSAIEDRTSDTEYNRILQKWDRDRLRAVFQELYLGSERYEELEDGTSSLGVDGYIEEETVLLDEEVRNHLVGQFSVGILTGRPRAEAEIALDRVELDLDPGAVVAMEDWDKSKPHPSALMNLADRFDAVGVAYAGDTLDDVRTARKADREDENRHYYGFGTLTGGLTGDEGRRKFLQEGATGVLDTVNELPEYLPR
jgi:HAD superfamily phosphatase